MNLQNLLKERFHVALSQLVPNADAYLDQIRPSQDVKFGDYQANMAMPLGKILKKSPREVAQQIVDLLEWEDILEKPEIAGPGFINLKWKNDWLAQQIQHAITDDRLGVDRVAQPQTIVIDFSAPNVAKPMHVGHIRSTMIGNALALVHRFLGHRVIADNHIGDWGTQFGMIIYGYRHFVDSAAYQAKPVEELARLYRLVRQLVDYHAAKKSRQTLQEQIQEAQNALSNEKTCLAQLQIDQNALASALDQQKSAQDAASSSQLTNAEPSSPAHHATFDQNQGGKDLANQLKDAKDALKKANKEWERQKSAFAVLLEKEKELGQKIESVEKDPALLALAEQHPEIGQDVLIETSKLHHGNQENRELWREFLPSCTEDINKIYRRLGVQFDTMLGESFYNDRLGLLVEQLKEQGIARESEGAVCVFLDNQDVPMLIQKKDGAFLYATTDLATLEYRQETYHPDAILYVVDFRQSLHFEQLFSVAQKIGLDHVKLVHVKFGTVLGKDGRPFKTRSGDTVGLESLLDEAERRAFEIVSTANDAKSDESQRNALLNDAERQEIAQKVGIGALVYADLSQNRESDYVFNYDKMLAMNGNTATYMQYAYARVRSIFSKGKIDVAALESNVDAANARHESLFLLAQPSERALALELLKFSESLDAVVKDYRLNLLTTYLFDLANRYSAFFENCPVLKCDEEAIRTSRLLLCDLTAKTIQKGLNLLGIETVERM